LALSEFCPRGGSVIRISVESTDYHKYRLKPLVHLKNCFWENGIIVDWNLKNPDLRVVNQHGAVGERRDHASDSLGSTIIGLGVSFGVAARPR
jgi:hypothetical protein